MIISQQSENREVIFASIARYLLDQSIKPLESFDGDSKDSNEKYFTQNKVSSYEQLKKKYRKSWGCAPIVSCEHEMLKQSFQLSLKDHLDGVDFYVNAKQQLIILEDLRKGIWSQYCRMYLTDHLILIRDASNQHEQLEGRSNNKDLVPIEWEEWARIGLAYFQIAEQILAQKAKTEYIRGVRALALAFLNKLSYGGKVSHPEHYTYHVINKQLPRLMLSSVDDDLSDTGRILQLLQSLKDFGNMQEEPCVLVTITDTAYHKRIVEVDVPITQLSQVQQNEYRYLIRSDHAPQWFRSLSDVKKAMVGYYAQKICDGACVIPAQMLTQIPGLRNAGEKRVYSATTIDSSNSPGVALTLETTLIHSGNLAQDIAVDFKENVRLAKENIRAMKSVQSGKTMCIESHVSAHTVILAFAAVSVLFPPLGIAQVLSVIARRCLGWDTLFDWVVKNLPGKNKFGINERRLHLVLQQAVQELNAEAILLGQAEKPYIYSNEALDWSRVFWFMKEEQTVEHYVLKQVNALRPIQGFEEKYAKLDVFIRQLNNLHRLQWSSWVLGRQKSAERKALVAQIVSLHNELCSPDQKIACVSFCKSGKDRQGFVEFVVALNAGVADIKGAHSLSLSDKMNTVVGKNLALSGHTQARAGLQGGSIGSDRLKNEGRVLPWGLNKEIEHALVGGTIAAANKKIKTKTENAVMKELAERVGDLSLRQQNANSLIDIEYVDCVPDNNQLKSLKSVLQNYPKTLVKRSPFWVSCEYPDGIQRIIKICEQSQISHIERWAAIRRVINEKCVASVRSRRGIYEMLNTKFDNMEQPGLFKAACLCIGEYVKAQHAALNKLDRIESCIFSKM